MNKYQKAISKLAKTDMKFCKEGEPLWDESYYFHKLAVKDQLKMEQRNNIQGAKDLRKELIEIF